MLSLFSQSDSKPQDHKETSSFDLNSFVGSIAGSTQKQQPSGSKNGVESYLDVSSEKIDRKKFVPVKNTAKPASKSSNTDDRKSKDQSHSSQSHKNGHTDHSKDYKKDDRGRDVSRDYRDSDKSKQSSHRDKEEKKSTMDYDPLGRKHEGGNGRTSNAYDDMPIKKKPADGHDGRNGEYSPKIKKVHEPSSPKIKKAEPSSPKIKKADPLLAKRPEVSPAKPRPSQTPPSRPDANKSSMQNSSRPIPRKPDDSIPKKPQSGASQPSSRPVSAKPTSSSPAPSRPSLGSKPTTPAGKPSSLGKPLPAKPLPAKPSSMSQSPRPLGQKPGLNGSMGSKPVSKPGTAGLGSRPVGPQSAIKKDFAAPAPKPGMKPGMRPVSQSPKPGQGKPMNNISAEKRHMEMKERMQKEKMLGAKNLMDSKTNLMKRPLPKPDSRMEPSLIKKPKLSASEKKQTLNSIFKGAPKKKKHFDSEDDDYDDNDSFIDDGDDDADEAMNEFNRMMTGYRKRVMMSKPYEDDIDDMEVGFDRIVAEEEWTKHVGELEDRREAEYIKKEMEEEQQALMKRKRKLKI